MPMFANAVINHADEPSHNYKELWALSAEFFDTQR